MTHHNNIALIKLKHPTKFTWLIQTVCLSMDDNNLPNDFTASGHGLLSTSKLLIKFFKNNNYAKKLREFQIFLFFGGI